MSGHTATPWKSTNAVKASNFGSVASRVTAMVPDPAKPGEMTGVTIAKVFGGLQDVREVAEANAAFIVTACNSLADLVKALEPFANLANGYDDEIDSDDRPVGPVALKFCRAARAALAKVSECPKK